MNEYVIDSHSLRCWWIPGTRDSFRADVQRAAFLATVDCSVTWQGRCVRCVVEAANFGTDLARALFVRGRRRGPLEIIDICWYILTILATHRWVLLLVRRTGGQATGADWLIFQVVCFLPWLFSFVSFRSAAHTLGKRWEKDETLKPEERIILVWGWFVSPFR